MRPRKELIIIIAIAILVTLTIGVRLGFCSPKIACEDIRDIPFFDLDDRPVTITSATMVAATSTVPGHCDVRGTIWPEIKFAVKLPTIWNNRFYMAGNGGYAGTIPHSGMVPGLQRYYATAGTDTGHDSEKEPLATFAWYDPVKNPHAEQKVVDYCYRAVNETAVLAKKIINSYYGSGPLYSYWVGCSTGGRQALMEAQRFPEDFDGLIVGAPVLDFSGTQMWGIWNAQALLGEGSIAVGKLPILANAVYNKCDGIDGLVDGLIDDPRNCTFDPAVDLPKCLGDVDGPNCFTTAQIEALQKIYGGVKTSWGELLFPGLPPGAEVLAPTSGWARWIIGSPSLQLLFGETFMQYMAFTPAPGPTYDWKTYNFDTDPPKMATISAMLDAKDPNLWPFKQRGGKMIHYHGWADPALNALMSVNYYEDVLNFMGRRETKEFYKFYLVPGMFHCAGGVGCSTVDWFTPLVDWVEKGIAPNAIIGSRIVSGQVVRTRPLCPYPEFARYTGTGSIDEAQNFICVVPAEVQIKPETLNLRSKGEFTAFITLPEEYDVRGWEARNVVCEGAPAVKGTFAKQGRTYIAKFKREDLINITAGEAVRFMVRGVFEHNGQRVAFEGSDNVRVIK